ncbi:MAG: DNA-directed RNA polymerase subunit beta [Omnitrophica WOR_2 bacterium GWF2_38_59]|nr:MAG: DNA-directed RNA polymerase subunit beta [Omnitrophica WOR_2 bacterium GWA2_37_7]OGX25248.1 MAG: DNA-directed RNA polymerase subunit beta [Omnitrophica WOR_2 bacterium GWF2_38_59]OGX47920.1 MAG: DNA-directed RNA polymerase subunit beta [Omnitrophica WOR_2 bacterium RIFOXYA2_FULL_38_17]OGX56257.1 MAG: DNA-directed RNA polymerase subunit beta [Omnitrophica WOR_2 bacterium RIFOXYC2_FULL_38_12]OGX60238.1 MAG: DNA-directed RNA polymerase subunit beta [Omnitrophica WOR_2 bacterium RIFOXYB2_FU
MEKINIKDFSKVRDNFDFPQLLDIQLVAYEQFLQRDIHADKREEQGLEEVFREVFPLESYDGQIRLEYMNYSLGKEKYSAIECKRRGLNYSAPLKVKLRLITPVDIKEQEVYFGDFPLMTDTGTFIINGDERVVVSQIQRPPGVSFEEELHPTGKSIFHGRIIPSRGAWFEIKYDLNNVLLAYIDRRRNFPATQILRIMGLSSNEDIKQMLGDDFAKLAPTFEKDHTENKEEALLDFYRKMRPTEPATIEVADALFFRLFFEPKRYDLSKVGRHIINRKLGTNTPSDNRVLDIATVVEVIRYLAGLRDGVGETDDIDHLGNRRIKTVGELVQNQVRIGLSRLERSIKERLVVMNTFENLTAHHLINSRLFSNQIQDFFARSQLSQFMDQVNPLSEMTHKRRLSALGPGGLSRERAGFEVRDVHPTHYGRVCPIETPEGPNIGLIASLTNCARVNDLGFIETPYRKVVDGKVTKKIEFLTADKDQAEYLAQANAPVDEDGNFLEDEVACRYKTDFPKVHPSKVSYMDVSPLQIVSVAASLIPFLEHDDANRALMGSNMQRQAVPLMIPEVPRVGTGIEEKVARDSGVVVIAKESGVVTKVDASEIVVNETVYPLKNYQRTNANTCIHQTPLVKIGEKIKAGQTIADGIGTKNGRLALGRNVKVAFMPWRGYNFEDAILINEKIVREDVFTSIHIEKFEVECRETRLGNEEVTRDIPNVGEEALINLNEDGIIRVGAEVKAGDILVGKVTPKSEKELSPEERLLRAIFGEKAADIRDTSMTLSPGIEGVVVNIEVFQRNERGRKSKVDKTKEDEVIEKIKAYYRQEIHFSEEEKEKKLSKLLGIDGKKLSKIAFDDFEEDSEEREIVRFYNDKIAELVEEETHEIERVKRGDELPAGVLKRVIVYVATKRKLSEGDKMAGRHGNKGVISRILPEEDMPFLADGTAVDIVLNPLGVPSRMNVGQLLETHLGWTAEVLGFHAVTPVFNGASEDEIVACLKEAGLPETGKTTVYDGYTGLPFDQKVTVGIIYMIKLNHLVDEKIHARSIGPYSLVTQQPLGGKAHFGGQRFGEMEVWALEAYGAAYTLQEMLTVKSDDVLGRSRMYEAIVKGHQKLAPGTPESFNVLVKELQGLCLDIKMVKAGTEPGFLESVEKLKGKKAKND